jgi:hypothetical protein
MNLLCCIGCCFCGNSIKDTDIEEYDDLNDGDNAMLASPKAIRTRSESKNEEA